jgi:hypothetical protein
VVILALMDPDTDLGTPIESGSNPDPDTDPLNEQCLWEGGCGREEMGSQMEQEKKVPVARFSEAAVTSFHA